MTSSFEISFLALYPTQFSPLSIFNTFSKWKHTWKKKIGDWSNFQIFATHLKISQTYTETKQICTAFTLSYKLFQPRMPLCHKQAHAFVREFDKTVFLCFVSIYEWFVSTGNLKFPPPFTVTSLPTPEWPQFVLADPVYWFHPSVSGVFPSLLTVAEKQDIWEWPWTITVQNDTG